MKRVKGELNGQRRAMGLEDFHRSNIVPLSTIRNDRQNGRCTRIGHNIYRPDHSGDTDVRDYGRLHPHLGMEGRPGLS